MFIKEILTQNRRDFTAIYECQHCGHQQEGTGYDDNMFHKNVVPMMKCKAESCGKTAPESYRPLQPRYGTGEII